MKYHILSPEQINNLVLDNRYKIDPTEKLLSRCIDDRYQEDVGLHPLALPGADAGELALIFATANSYGLEVDQEKVFISLVEVVGGEEHFHFHTDNHHSFKDPAAGCGHFSQMSSDPKSYSLEQKDIEFIKEKLKLLLKDGVEEEVLFGEHYIGAVLIIRGQYNIYPCYVLEGVGAKKRVEFLLHHQTMVDERHKVLAKKLVENKVVALPSGCDEEYLYEALSETSENHLMETVKRLAMGLPIYQVIFNEEGEFKIEEMGKVE